MVITDIFIKRPVLATVLSLLILVLGLRSIFSLPVRQYPFTQNAVITVTTIYTGADSNVIAGFITTPLENSIAQANGIDYLSSSSTQGVSTIQAYLRLNYDPNKALNEINTKVNAVLYKLPKAALLPSISIAIGESIDAMYMGFYSSVLARNQITDYLIRAVQPKLQAIEGVQEAEILGGRPFALRAWLDSAKLAGYKLTAADVSQALANNNFISAIGRTDGSMITIGLTASTDLSNVDEFRQLIIKSENGAIIRLGDVATVTLGAETYDNSVSFDGKPSVYIGIKVAPGANLLSVIDRVRKVFPTIQGELPQGLDARIVYDATKFVNSAIYEVEKSLFEAILIVTAVIFIFLGSIRSVIIPVVAIPLSLIGSFLIMLLLGYSINLLTLLSLILAIGLVVDDAIIIVENIYRRMNEGMSTMEAAIQGTRELANPIIAISVVLIAVYIPIGFMGGLTGALFTEFAFTLAGAVGISAIIALTLSPMMCSQFLVLPGKNHGKTRQEKFLYFIDQQFEKLREIYKKYLSHVLNNMPLVIVFSLIILICIYFLYNTSTSELAPQEDQGVIITQLTTASNASLLQTQLYSKQVYDIFTKFPEMDHVFTVDGRGGLNASINGMVLKPWDERTRTSNELQPLLQEKINKIAGAQVVAFQLPSLPGSSGLPVQFIIETTESFERLNEVAQSLLDKTRSSGAFGFVDLDLKFNKAQSRLIIDRDKASELGLNMLDIGNALGGALSNNYVNYFNFSGRSYQVIPQMIRSERLNNQQLMNYFITTSKGDSVALSTIAHLKNIVIPQSLNHFQQLNSATISGVAATGLSMGEVLDVLKKLAKETLPSGYSIDYAGQARQFISESTGFVITFFFAIIIIFLSLAALFESFRDPFIVLISVPMSICGALIFISMGIGQASLNIYTEVGLVTLIGLISKHGILIVQFANDLQREGLNKHEAIQEAASIRLRPILMTTAAMVLGVLPLIMAKGAGAVSRFNIGLVIASGISIGTFFTLFVVPSMYLLLAKDHKKTQTNLSTETSFSS